MEQDNQELINGDSIVYDILNHWYDSYYITKDLWTTYTMDENNNIDIVEPQNIITIFNVSNWHNVELKSLFIFIILERFGDDMLKQGSNILNIKVTTQQQEQIDVIRNKLISSYGNEIQIDYINDYMIAIDLNSWSQCISNDMYLDEQSDIDSDDDESLIDKDVYLE